MTIDLLLQLLGLIILLGGVWFGYQRWARPYMSQTDTWGKGLLMLIVVTGVGGFLGSPFWWLDLTQSFSWDLPPLASRLLACAALAFAAGCYLCLKHPTARRVRLILLLSTVYLVPLVIAVLLFHLDRFNFAAPLTYGFFILVVGVGAASVVYLLRQPVIINDQPHGSLPASGITKGWLILVGVLLGAWGLALFITDAGPFDFIWIWAGDLLTSRLIAVMLLAIAAGAFYSTTSEDSAHMILTVVVIYGFGVAFAIIWSLTPSKSVYFITFGILAGFSPIIVAIDRYNRQAKTA